MYFLFHQTQHTSDIHSSSFSLHRLFIPTTNDDEQAAVHHIGMYRSRTSRLPIQYYNRLPHTHASDVAFILDPCVGTSDTLQAVCGIIEKW